MDVNLNSRSRDCIFLLRYKSGKFIQDIYTGFYIRPLCTPNKFIPPQVLTCQIFSKLGIVNHQENSIKIIPLEIILACPQIQNEILLLAPLQQCSCSRCSLRYSNSRDPIQEIASGGATCISDGIISFTLKVCVHISFQ